jgi:carbohydrate-binding DOMON domain-containing protein
MKRKTPWLLFVAFWVAAFLWMTFCATAQAFGQEVRPKWFTVTPPTATKTATSTATPTATVTPTATATSTPTPNYPPAVPTPTLNEWGLLGMGLGLALVAALVMRRT